MSGPRDPDEVLAQFTDVTARARRPAWQRTDRKSLRPALFGALSVTVLLAIVTVAVLGSPITGPVAPGPSATAATTAPTAPNATPTDPNATPTEPSLAELAGNGFTFEYPAEWRVIRAEQQAGPRDPAVLAAVGIGDFEYRCFYNDDVSGCPATPDWTIPDNGIVLAYYFVPWPAPTAPDPSPGEQTDVDGRDAVLSQSLYAMTWQLKGAPEYIGVHWGHDLGADGARLAQQVIDSWEWSAAERSPSPVPTPTEPGEAVADCRSLDGQEPVGERDTNLALEEG